MNVKPLLLFDELYCLFDQSGVAVAGATNAAIMRRMKSCYRLLIFSSLHPHAINPITSTHGHFLPPLNSFIPPSREQDAWWPVEFNDRHHDLTEK